MANNPNEDTEFNDALRKHGILPPRPVTPPTPERSPSPSLSDVLAQETPSALSTLADEAPDSDTERMIQAYRQRRLAELKREEKRARFGEVLPISREDYTREVTDASKVDEDDDEGAGKGTGVVCFLYKDGGHVPSIRIAAQLRTLAARYPNNKFVSIVGDKCIPDYPNHLIPTLIMYRKGEMIGRVVSWSAKKELSIEDLEILLVSTGAIIPPKKPAAAASAQRQGAVSNLSDDDDSETERRPTKNIRGRPAVHNEDSDSDFDL